MNDIVNEVKARMQRIIDSVKLDFNSVRTGKASPSLVENIVVKAYGGTTPLKVLELATIHVQDPQTLILTPFDKSIIGEIEHGIGDAKVGLSPVVDGEFIRINLPPLSEERRLEFVKVIHQKAEAGKVMLRQARQEGMGRAKKLEDKDVSEDEIVRIEKEIQKLTDDFTEQIDNFASQKEEELMKV